MQSVHKTVLLQETIEGLNLKHGSIVIDATFGGGGHSLEICKRYPDVKIIAVDQDSGAFEKAKHKFEGQNCDITFVNINFRDIGKVFKESFVASKSATLFSAPPSLSHSKSVADLLAGGIIFDLGLSSDQLENSKRGFSFMKDEPLLMHMKISAKENPEENLTAMDVVNTWSEESLADIIYGYGEERYSRRIAKAIVDARQKVEIKTTFDLVKIISESVPAAYRRGRLHFATRTFQAIRIAVNDELGALSEGLEKGFGLLKVGGRMSVISFHSLEDRIVKRFFQSKVKVGQAKLVNKKVILAADMELKENPRSRSAKLRILEKII